MFITKKHLSRRTLLRGLGVTLGAAVAGFDASGANPAEEDCREPDRRDWVSCMFRTAPSWTNGRPRPKAPDFEFSPILKPLEPFRDRLNVVSGLGNRAADTTAVHSLSPTTWLSGVRPKPTQGVDAYAGVTADQIAAQHIGQDTLLPSIELATEDHSGAARRLRPRLRLHLHEHAVLADAHHADADGDQSAQSVRAHVRARRHGRANGPRAPRKTAAFWTRSRPKLAP